MKFDKSKYGFIVDCEATYYDMGLKKQKQYKWYTCWINMIKRCYDVNNPNYKTYGEKGVYIDDTFKRLSEFRDFYIEHNKNEDLELDKDILGKGYYGVDSVLFVSKTINLSESYNRNKDKLSAHYKEMQGDKHFRAKSKEYYEETPTTKSNFKKICKTQGWDFDDFEEISSGKKAKDRHILYFFKIKDL